MDELRLITDQFKNLNLNQEKINKFTEIFKNLNKSNISLKEIHKLSHILGISPQKFGKILKSITQQNSNNISIPKNKPSKIGRNHKCPCDSNKKYKNCCGSTKPVISEYNTEHNIVDCLCGSDIPWEDCCGSTKPVISEYNTEHNIVDCLCGSTKPV
jgi:hypothetical protein